jgi:hypothetical protein
MAKKNEIAKRRTGAVTKANMSDQMLMDAEDGSGFENITADDLAIPFISILQALSPQVKKGEAQIDGAEEGFFFNNVTNEVLGDEIRLISCAYEKVWNEWVLRENGGGFAFKHGDGSILLKTTKDGKKRNILENGNQIVDTAVHYCLLVDENGVATPVVVGFTSTQLKKSRRWNSTMKGIKLTIKGKGTVNPPMYSHIYTAKTVMEDNQEGEWAGWLIVNPEMITDPDLYSEARKLHDDVTAGQVRTAPPPQEGGAAGEPTEEVF